MAAASGSSGKMQAKPSAKLNPKTVDAFHATKGRSVFASVYSTGGIPCRLEHGSVKHKLLWSQNVEELDFDPLLVLLAEGIRETIHPYPFVARNGFRELLETSNAGSKAIPLLPRVVAALRTAIGDKDEGVFKAGLQAVVQLSDVIGPDLNAHLKGLLPPVSKRMMGKQHREDILESLQRIELNGGHEALLIIKSKVPTYSSSFTGV